MIIEMDACYHIAIGDFSTKAFKGVNSYSKNLFDANKKRQMEEKSEEEE